MSKHTSGHWETKPHNPTVVVCGTRVIARVRDLCIDSQLTEDCANARLIAAAPELLEAVKAAREVLLTRDGCESLGADLAASIRASRKACDILADAIRAASAKAEGGAA